MKAKWKCFKFWNSGTYENNSYKDLLYRAPFMVNNYPKITLKWEIFKNIFGYIGFLVCCVQ